MSGFDPRLSLSSEQLKVLIQTIKTRFDRHKHRHPACSWQDVEARLCSSPAACWSLSEMERTGGEPDVVGSEAAAGQVLFFDCASETPIGRRSLCYDRAGLESRKEHPPANSAMDVAAAMGIDLLDEEQYRLLQSVGEFDTKTSSWVKTPLDIRERGGALFGDRRYGHVFIYHNGAQSYYSARAFRGVLRL